MSMNHYLARFSGEPVLIEASQVDRFRANLAALASEKLPEAAGSGDFWTELGEWDTAKLRPYVVVDGVLQIPIRGVLLKDFPYQFFSCATGYEYIRAAFRRGLDDSNVKGIALIVDSPGGMVAGNFDLADEIYAGRATKPIMGFANEHAYSAAYSLISSVTPGNLHVARTGGVGSIGVVTMHIDVSKAMDEAGVAVTYIFAGKHKVDGNPYEALSPDVKDRIQSRINDLYSVFVSTVARNRGLDEQAVRDTEALTFTAAEAQSNGLADSIGTIDEATAAFAASLDDDEPSDNPGEDQMAEQANTSAVDQAAHDAAVAAARKEGAAAEQTRIAAILGSEEAKGRGSLANHIAFKTSMSAEDAVSMLTAAPKEPDASAAQQQPQRNDTANSFAAAMDATGNPNVGGGPAGNGNESGNNDDQGDVLASLKAMGLVA